MRLLKNADEPQSSENGDSPEHRKRDTSQAWSVEPSTSLVSDDLLLPKVTEEEGGETAEGGATAEGAGTDVVDGSSGGQPMTTTQLPGLFDEDDPESNELFGSAS